MEDVQMPTSKPIEAESCNCLAIRQASRQITQLYERYLAPTGLRATQFSILAKLYRSGPVTINALADALVMDRTTLGRNILPLERDGLLQTVRSDIDRRAKELRLTEAGLEKLKEAQEAWHAAQDRFAALFGAERATDLRALMREISTLPVPEGPASDD